MICGTDLEGIQWTTKDGRSAEIDPAFDWRHYFRDWMRGVADKEADKANDLQAILLAHLKSVGAERAVSIPKKRKKKEKKNNSSKVSHGVSLSRPPQ